MLASLQPDVIFIIRDFHVRTLWNLQLKTESSLSGIGQNPQRRLEMRSTFTLAGILALFLASIAGAHPGDTLWTRIHGGSGEDRGLYIQQTSDGGYIITGHTTSFGAGFYDVYLVKTDANGDTLWTRTYGGTNGDYSYYIEQTADDGYIIVGLTTSFGAGGNDLYLLKTDINGDTLWTRAHGGIDDECGQCVRQTADGGYIVVGYTKSFGANPGHHYDVWLLKTDANGDTLWTRTYGGSMSDEGWYIQETTDGEYIIAGMTASFGAGWGDFYLLKTDANGDTLWTRAYGGWDYDYARCVQQTADGGYIMGGAGMSDGAGPYDVYLVRTDPNGDTLWTRKYGGALDDQIYSLRQTSDGGYICVGPTKSFGAGEDDLYLLRTDANGDTLWTRTYGGVSSDYGSCIQHSSHGGYIIVGWTGSFGAGPRDCWLLKVVGEAQPVLSVEITPDDPPVTVPPGGRFGYTGSLTNNTNERRVTDVWVMAVGPQKGVHGPFKEFYDLELDPYQTHTVHFNQRVSHGAPLGFYTYIAYCGDYLSSVTDSSCFQVEVVAGPAGDATGWLLTGSFREGDSANLPSEFALHRSYPNPFNATTVITYELPTEAQVKLEVYNISGQKVATLVESRQQSGYRSVVWDASEVSSGVYFYELSAGDFTETKRMMLVK
jgi:hypothetical protein